MTTPYQAAREAISALYNGATPNGIHDDELGEWAACYRDLCMAHEADGTRGVRRAFDVIAHADKRLYELIAGSDQETDDPRSWGKVLPFQHVDLPPFPIDIFPPWLRDYVAAVTETMQTPPDLAGMLALSILSTACARRVMVRAWDGWVEPVNIYTVTSLGPGNRKSPVFRAMMAPVVKFEQDQTERRRERIMQAETSQDIMKQQLEDLKRKAAKAKDRGEYNAVMGDIDTLQEEMRNTTVPPMPKYIVDDVTPEPLASILAEQQGRVAVLSPEGDIFGIMAGRYTSGPPNLGVYLKAHAGDPIRVDRRTRSEHVRFPALTMGITTQPEVMRSFGSNSAFRGQGLLARFFYALPISTVGSRETVTDPVPDQVRRDYFRTVMYLLEYMESHFGNSGNNVTVPIDTGDSDTLSNNDDLKDILYLEILGDAKVRFIEFNRWIEPQLSPLYGALAHLGDWAAKLAGGVLRTAGLLHIAKYAGQNCQNCRNPIDDETMANAIRFADYLIPHANAAYAEIGADPSVEAAKQVLRWIEKTSIRSFTRRDCYRSVKGPFKRADDCDPALTLLVDHGYLREVQSVERDGPGRKPSPIYEVNPIIFGGHISQNRQN